MNLNRKNFLLTLAGGAAGLLAGTASAAEPSIDGIRPKTALPAFDASDEEAYWRAVRGQFLLEEGFSYFNTGGLGPISEGALAASEATTRRLQKKCENGHGLLAGARASIARFFGAPPEDLAFVRNATEGNSIIAAGMMLGPGDEVVFESHAHPGGSYPWLMQARSRGVIVKLFEPDPAQAAGNVARIAALLTERTRAVQVSHVTAPTGIVMPVAEIGRLCRERGIWFHIDGAQSAGMFPFALPSLGCDSYATSGHKWLGGPLETGLLYVPRARAGSVVPLSLGAYAAELETLPGDLRVAHTAQRFEYGTRDPAAAIGLAAAVDFLGEIGIQRIGARGRALAARVRAGLLALPDVQILTPAAPEACASILTFRSPRIGHAALVEKLLKQRRLRCRPVSEQGLDAVRVSTHHFNLTAECDALVEAVGQILKAT